MQWSLLVMERIMEMIIGLLKIRGVHLGAKVVTFEWHETEKIIVELLLLLPIPLSRFILCPILFIISVLLLFYAISSVKIDRSQLVQPFIPVNSPMILLRWKI